MQKAAKADVFLCLSCGARARLVVDEDSTPAPTIVPMPYPVAPSIPSPFDPFPGPVWRDFSPIRWTGTSGTTDVPMFPDGVRLEMQS